MANSTHIQQNLCMSNCKVCNIDIIICLYLLVLKSLVTWLSWQRTSIDCSCFGLSEKEVSHVCSEAWGGLGEEGTKPYSYNVADNWLLGFPFCISFQTLLLPAIQSDPQHSSPPAGLLHYPNHQLLYSKHTHSYYILHNVVGGIRTADTP